MARKLARLLLWLLVINLGLAMGAGIYESRVVVPGWLGTSPRSWPNTGVLFWVYVTTVPLTLLMLVSFVVAWYDQRPRRSWWLGALVIVVVERLTTFSYFIPTMLRLTTGDPLPQQDADAVLTQWMLLDYGRHALTLAAWLMALRAFSLPTPRPQDSDRSAD